MQCANTTRCDTHHSGIYWRCECTTYVYQTQTMVKLVNPSVDYLLYRVTESECKQWISDVSNSIFVCYVKNNDAFTVNPNVSGHAGDWLDFCLA